MVSKPRNVPLTPDEIEAFLLIARDIWETEALDDEDLDNEVDQVKISCNTADGNLLRAVTNVLNVSQNNTINIEFLTTENTDLDDGHYQYT